MAVSQHNYYEAKLCKSYLPRYYYGGGHRNIAHLNRKKW